MGLKAS